MDEYNKLIGRADLLLTLSLYAMREGDTDAAQEATEWAMTSMRQADHRVQSMTSEASQPSDTVHPTLVKTGSPA